MNRKLNVNLQALQVDRSESMRGFKTLLILAVYEEESSNLVFHSRWNLKEVTIMFEAYYRWDDEGMPIVHGFSCFLFLYLRIFFFLFKFIPHSMLNF